MIPHAARDETPAISTTGRQRPSRLRRSDGWWPWAFITPLLLGIGLFYIWPILQTLYFSFTDVGVFGGATWTGFDNYVRLIQDPEFYLAVRNTLIYTAIVVLGIPVGTYMASLLNRPGLRFASVYRALFFLPFISLPVAVSLVWRAMYNGDFGVFNYGLSLLGIEGPYWLSTEGLALVSIAIFGLWGSLGFAIIILGAGLKSIPGDVYEAAELDGASPWRQFISITVPLLSPSIFFVTIVTVIGSFQLFDSLYAMLGPRNPVLPETQSLVFLFYTTGFVDNNKGYAAAIALAIMVIIGLVTILQFRIQKKWVNYE